MEHLGTFKIGDVLKEEYSLSSGRTLADFHLILTEISWSADEFEEDRYFLAVNLNDLTFCMLPAQMKFGACSYSIERTSFKAELLWFQKKFGVREEGVPKSVALALLSRR